MPGTTKEKITIIMESAKNLIPIFVTKSVLDKGIEHKSVRKLRVISLLSKITSVAFRLVLLVL